MKSSMFSWPIWAARVRKLIILLVISASLLSSACTSRTSQPPQISSVLLKNQVYHLTGQPKTLKSVQRGPFTLFVLPISFLPSPHFGIGNIVKGSDGAMWFEQFDDGLIGRITSSGNFMVFQLPNYLGSEASPVWITSGSDGAIWFTDSGAVGRITSGGTLTVFFLPMPDANPLEITAGADGAVWFVEGVRQSKIGRLTAQGVLTEFPLATTASAIVAGPDGSLWFIENPVEKIGRITVSGKVVKEFPIPESIEGNELAVGADGNLWFSTDQTVSNQIGRMTPDGHFTFFSLATTTSVEQIANDGNGSMVFTAVDANKIGIMTTQGNVSKLFSIPQPNAYPYALAMRVPGEYWFTEIGTSTTSGMGMIGVLKTT